MNQYHILSASGGVDWNGQLADLHRQMTELSRSLQSQGLELRWVKVFVSDLANQQMSLHESPLFVEYLSRVAHTVVEQPPLAAGVKIMLLAACACVANDCVQMESWRLSDADLSDGCHDSYTQAMLLFERYVGSLERRGLSLCEHCLRTWIYVRDIDNNYAGMVRARNEVFARHGLTPSTHFIVSTGIGGATAVPGALVALDTLTADASTTHEVRFLEALDHLNRTHEYGVAFERGGLFRVGDEEFCLISGTASIDRGGRVLHEGDVLAQAARIRENIAALLADGGLTLADVRYYLVYVRDVSDRDAVCDYLRHNCADVPCVLVHAPVCRSNWLIEMECVARRRVSEQSR